MKRIFSTIGSFLLVFVTLFGQENPSGQSKIFVQPLADNAVRIVYTEGEVPELPALIYGGKKPIQSQPISVREGSSFSSKGLTIKWGGTGSNPAQGGGLVFLNAQLDTIFKATAHELRRSQVQGEPTYEATLRFESPADEFLYGLGQFQDDYTNVRGLSRRLTQVNTQIAVPMVLSNRGYAVLWNNYGLTDFNPAHQFVALQKQQGEGKREEVDVTSTEGGRKEVRESNVYSATLEIAEEGDYSLLLDVGQTMARSHNLVIDGETVIDMHNLWLPPTTSAITHLTAGTHTLQATLTQNDKPVLYYQKVAPTTTFRSPVANAVDYTLFFGTPDEIIASFRQLSGDVPMLPRWAMGYVHCRERFHSSAEILTTAERFRRDGLPIDVIVQDWQWWGHHGWNSMQFDERNYPDPKALTDSLHGINIRLMLSVWSKIDKNSSLGKQMLDSGYYIPGTDWIDFFNPDAAKAYWTAFRERLVPTGIDAWWQDATEPENDDLLGRRVQGGALAGERVRNVYPLMVNQTVYEGLKAARPNTRPMILTRSGFSGMQRYGSVLWSGDVGNDWETLRRQITAGLGLQSAGQPWWTYDAGGFFRPGNQYTDAAYQQRMMRWIQTSVYLPLMRVHGYVSNTEPWNYSSETQTLFAQSLRERYRLLPYIYSCASSVSLQGSTLMRPLVFDFANDTQALRQKYEYMFGPALLVNPITAPDVRTWNTYLPQQPGGWYDFHTGQHYDGCQTVSTQADKAYIPVFVRAGSIVPLGIDRQHTGQQPDAPLTVHVYPGANGSFTLYEDDGISTAYEQGQRAEILMQWDDSRHLLTISSPRGRYAGMPKQRQLNIVVEGHPMRSVTYKNKAMKLKME